jgi:phage FluMu protein Com
MPIEFRCAHCGKLLRTGDQTAGKQAQCPECRGVMTIPAVSEVLPGGTPPQLPPDGTPLGAAGPQASAPAEAGSPFGPSGTFGPASAYRPQGAIAKTALDFADILDRTWNIFKQQWTMCLVVVLIVMAISFTLSFMVTFGHKFLVLTGNSAASVTFSVLAHLATSAIGIWLGIGQAVFFLKTARGETVEIGEIFAGGPYFWRILGATLALALVIFGIVFVCMFPLLLMGGLIFGSQEAIIGLAILGALVALVPYAYVMLTLSQFYYLILDRNVGIMESFTLSQQLMSGNKLTLFLIWLVTMLLGALLTILTCGLGALAVMPFISLMAAVIYLTITGQPTADPLRAGANN